jgi:hypothetical protein
MSLQDLANLSQPFIAGATLVGAAITGWIALLLYRWSKTIDRVQHLRLINEQWQTINLAILQNTSLKAIEASLHHFGSITELEVERLYFHFLKINVAHTSWTFQTSHIVDELYAESVLRNYCNITYGDRAFIEEHVLREADKASVWIPWYFKRGALTLVTAPLLLFLSFCIAISAFGAVIQGLALVRATYAVFGFIGAFIAVSFGWIPVILPPILYYSLMKNLPGLWLRPDASQRAKIFSSLAVIVLLPLAAYLIHHSVAWGIGWIADRDPCAVFSAGVTGSKPPVNCP